jgi:ATP synthase protein I
MDQSSIMSVELIAAILVWGGVGWLVDGWLGTTPWLFGCGVMVGFGAGLYLVWLRSERDQHYPNAAARARRTPDHPSED